MTWADVTAVLVTRGDQPKAVTRICRSLHGCREVIIRDNSLGEDLSVYGRYSAALGWVETPLVYIQDDDCIVDAEALVQHYEPGVVTVNMPAEHQEQYPGRIKLVGFGAIFDRSLINFSRYLAKWPADEIFYRECDRVFTFLNKCKVVDVGVRKLPHGNDETRMWREKRHGDDFKEICRRLEAL